MTPREEAARWLVLQDGRELTAGESQAFEQWLREPANAAAWRDAQRAWNVFEGEREAAPANPTLEQLRREALAMRPGDGEDEGAGSRGWSRMALAASVLLTTGVALLLLWRTDSPGPLRRADIGARAPVAVSTEHTTAIGERREIQLADGSRVTLNTGTSLAVRLAANERRVELRNGQATFDVTRDADRPFIVHAGARSVRAIGTVFDIQVSEQEVRVLLAEGRVEVAPINNGSGSGAAKAKATELAPGQLLVARHRGHAGSAAADVVTRIDVARALRWHEGLVEFDDESLRNAVAEMNRYTTSPVGIRDAATAALRISGLFRTDRMDLFLRDIEEILPVRVTRAADGQTEIAGRD